jgi:hypothetical protein
MVEGKAIILGPGCVADPHSPEEKPPGGAGSGRGMSEKQKALLLMLLSVFSLSVMQFIVKLSGDRITIMEQVFTRNFFCLIISMITLFASKGSFWGKAANRPALLTRSVLGFIGIAGYFYATKI